MLSRDNILVLTVLISFNIGQTIFSPGIDLPQCDISSSSFFHSEEIQRSVCPLMRYRNKWFAGCGTIQLYMEKGTLVSGEEHENAHLLCVSFSLIA